MLPFCAQSREVEARQKVDSTAAETLGLHLLPTESLKGPRPRL